MKKILSLLTLCLGVLISSLCVGNEEGSSIWKSAYEGNYSLTTKYINSKYDYNNSHSQELYGHMLMAYTYYRMGLKDEVWAIFKGIDSFIEFHGLEK